MGGIKRKPKKDEGSTRDAWGFLPSKIHVDHRRNYSREVIGKPPAELAPYLGDHCCFTLAEIEERLDSLKKHRQINPVSVYLTLTNDAFLVDGYLRHAAFLLAEVRGELDQIPGAAGKILCTPVPEPKSQADWLAIAERNYEENTAVKSLSPIDKARYAQRLMAPLAEGGFDLDAGQAAQRIGLTNKRQLDRYLRALKLPPTTIAEIHTGKKSLAAALDESSKTGQADSPGPRKGRSTAKLRKRFDYVDARPFPKQSLSPAGVVALLRDIAGLDVGEDPPADYLAWREELELTSDETAAIKSKLAESSGAKPRKKPAPKPDEARP